MVTDIHKLITQSFEEKRSFLLVFSRTIQRFHVATLLEQIKPVFMEKYELLRNMPMLEKFELFLSNFGLLVIDSKQQIELFLLPNFPTSGIFSGVETLMNDFKPMITLKEKFESHDE